MTRPFITVAGAVLLAGAVAGARRLLPVAHGARADRAIGVAARARVAQDGASAYTNRLIHEKSPYLLLHAHNPVDWYPWGVEAFAKARQEHKPIFLSIGYFTCHWCHVMERESYSNPAVASVLNRYFVAVKVDREERPDVDRLYIQYVEASTGSAGWPLNVFLTPERKPFLGGTYYPPGQLKTLLEKVAAAWDKNPADIEKTAGRAAQELAEMAGAQPAAAGALEPALLDQTFQKIAATYDAANGGFGGAPKFPRPVTMDYLLRQYARTGQRYALTMTRDTLRALAAGGIHDQLGGGFHRYSTGATWRVPHFEKMLYDQAQLAATYTAAYQAMQKPFFAETARDILDFTLREMRLPGGAFASAEDADSAVAAGSAETREGAFYVWSAAEIDAALGKQNAAVFDYALGVEPAGNVPPEQDGRGELAGKNVLYQAHSVEETAGHFGYTVAQAAAILGAARKTLFDARARRPHPPLDDKIVTAWNGMMISALARASRALSQPQYLEHAQASARFLEAYLYDAKSGTLWRSYRDGSPSAKGFLDDYTDLIAGLLDLNEADFDIHWLEWAVAVQQKQDQLFADARQGGYFDAGAADSTLLTRTREDYDGAEPSPNSTAAMNLLRLAQFTGRTEWRDEAHNTLAAFGGQLAADPGSLPALASALDFDLARTKQVLIAGEPGAPDTRVLLRQVSQRFLPNKILLLADGGAGQQQLARWLPFIAGAHRTKGRATAYVCENYVCKLPTADPQTLGRILDSKN